MIVKCFGCTTIHKKRYINASFIHSIILRSGSSATGNNSFSNLVGTGSNKHVVGLDAVISLFSSSCPIVVSNAGFLWVR